jgi:hypothetical protein
MAFTIQAAVFQDSNAARVAMQNMAIHIDARRRSWTPRLDLGYLRLGAVQGGSFEMRRAGWLRRYWDGEDTHGSEQAKTSTTTLRTLLATAYKDRINPEKYTELEQAFDKLVGWSEEGDITTPGVHARQMQEQIRRFENAAKAFPAASQQFLGAVEQGSEQNLLEVSEAKLPTRDGDPATPISAHFVAGKPLREHMSERLQAVAAAMPTAEQRVGGEFSGFDAQMEIAKLQNARHAEHASIQAAVAKHYQDHPMSARIELDLAGLWTDKLGDAVTAKSEWEKFPPGEGEMPTFRPWRVGGHLNPTLEFEKKEDGKLEIKLQSKAEADVLTVRGEDGKPASLPLTPDRTTRLLPMQAKETLHYTVVYTPPEDQKDPGKFEVTSFDAHRTTKLHPDAGGYGKNWTNALDR